MSILVTDLIVLYLCFYYQTIRSPEFFDEIKIQLPGKLEETHYLLFTFYHVICQTKKLESSASLETVIGYSVSNIHLFKTIQYESS